MNKHLKIVDFTDLVSNFSIFCVYFSHFLYVFFVDFALILWNAHPAAARLVLYILYYFLCEPHLFMIGRA